MTSVQHFSISRHVGQRLDNFLIRELKPLPRSRIMRMIRRGEVRVNGKRAKVHLKLSEGDRVRVPPIQLEKESYVTVPSWLVDVVRENVIYEDERLIAVNKPSGIAVHGGSSVPVGLVDAVREFFDKDIQLVHRIDRDTSGCVLFAKTRVALLELHHAFQHQKVIKRYEGIVAGCWPSEVSEISLPLRKFRLPNNERRVEVHADGKSSETKFEVMRTSEHLTWLQIELTTGRTHQIRVHCQHQGHPLIGDSKYASALQFKSSKMLLHAAYFHFNDQFSVRAPIPQYFEEFWLSQTSKG